MAEATVVRPKGVSWIAVLSGWLTTVGVTALLVPAAAALWPATTGANPNDVMLAVPPVLGVLMAYLIGGYVAGRMAGYRTSWHGLLTAFFGAFVVLVAFVLGMAAERGFLGDLRMRPGDGLAAVFGGPVTAGDALLFGAAMGLLVALIGGWIGGLLAPDHLERVAVPAAAPAVDRTTVAREPAPAATQAPARPGFRLQPSFGRKGGERERENGTDRPRDT